MSKSKGNQWVELRERAKRICTSADKRLGGGPSFLQAMWQEFQDDNGFTMAAAIAYYALFSFFPVVLLMITVSSFFLTSAEAQKEVIAWVERYMPASGGLVEANIGYILRVRGPVSIVAILGLFWSASGVFSALDRAVNRAWDVTELRSFWRQKLLSFGMIVGAGALLVLSIFSTTVFSVIRRLGLSFAGWQLFNNLLSALLPVTPTILIFFLLYKILPNTTVRWSDVWLGAILSGLGWELAKYLFTWYLTNFASYNLVYGSVAVIIAFLAWSYYTGVIFVLGAEFTAEYAKARRSRWSQRASTVLTNGGNSNVG